MLSADALGDYSFARRTHASLRTLLFALAERRPIARQCSQLSRHDHLGAANGARLILPDVVLVVVDFVSGEPSLTHH